MENKGLRRSDPKDALIQIASEWHVTKLRYDLKKVNTLFSARFLEKYFES